MTLEEQIRAASLGENVNQSAVANPISVDLGNGQVLTFQNQEDLSNNLRTALFQVNGEVAKLRNQVSEYEAQLNTQNSGQYVSSDEDVSNLKFNMDTFIEKMRTNPVEGFDYVDQFRKSEVKEKLRDLEGLKQEYEVGKFLQAHPEFPGGQYANILNATREELGLPMTKVGLEAALVQAQQNGRMPDFRVQQALQAQQMQFVNYLQMLQQQGMLPQPQPQLNNNLQQNRPIIQQNAPYQGGIPTVPRNQPQVSNDVISMAENMPLDKLEDLLKRNGML